MNGIYVVTGRYDEGRFAQSTAVTTYVHTVHLLLVRGTLWGIYTAKSMSPYTTLYSSTLYTYNGSYRRYIIDLN